MQAFCIDTLRALTKLGIAMAIIIGNKKTERPMLT